MVEISDFQNVSADVKAKNPGVFGNETLKTGREIAEKMQVINDPLISKALAHIGLTPKETEADFASWLEDILHLRGYKYAHFRPARVMRHGKEIYETPVSGDAAGLEDYFVWHEIKMVSFWVEIKSETGELSGKQNLIIASHKRAGIIVYVWRPSDRDTIMKIL